MVQTGKRTRTDDVGPYGTVCESRDSLGSLNKVEVLTRVVIKLFVCSREPASEVTAYTIRTTYKLLLKKSLQSSSCSLHGQGPAEVVVASEPEKAVNTFWSAAEANQRRNVAHLKR